jgi:hypothetical protein
VHFPPDADVFHRPDPGYIFDRRRRIQIQDDQSITLLQHNIWAIALFVNFTKPTACSNSKFNIAALQRYKKHPSRRVTHHKIKKNKRTITKKNHKEKQQTTSSKHHQMITTSNDNH